MIVISRVCMLLAVVWGTSVMYKQTQVVGSPGQTHAETDQVPAAAESHSQENARWRHEGSSQHHGMLSLLPSFPLLSLFLSLLHSFYSFPDPIEWNLTTFLPDYDSGKFVGESEHRHESDVREEQTSRYYQTNQEQL